MYETRGLQRDVVYICWPIAPPRNTSPNAGGGGSCGASANEYSCAHHVKWSQNNCGDLPPHLTYVWDFLQVLCRKIFPRPLHTESLVVGNFSSPCLGAKTVYKYGNSVLYCHKHWPNWQSFFRHQYKDLGSVGPYSWFYDCGSLYIFCIYSMYICMFVCLYVWLLTQLPNPLATATVRLKYI